MCPHFVYPDILKESDLIVASLGFSIDTSKKSLASIPFDASVDFFEKKIKPLYRDLLSTANNHFLDQDISWLLSTLKLLKKV